MIVLDADPQWLDRRLRHSDAGVISDEAGRVLFSQLQQGTNDDDERNHQ